MAEYEVVQGTPSEDTGKTIWVTWYRNRIDAAVRKAESLKLDKGEAVYIRRTIPEDGHIIYSRSCGHKAIGIAATSYC